MCRKVNAEGWRRCQITYMTGLDDDVPVSKRKVLSLNTSHCRSLLLERPTDVPSVKLCLCTIIFQIRQTLPEIATASRTPRVMMLLVKLIVHSHIASG
ncbi:hypothetical protein D6C86_00446 [Aureobasidium pullulans]|nr:hypothetical protein D6C86_00446 [Aureobasidium pullulans]THZ74264.1 hypothetical protein D6C88_07113 [Aureobasidium pullulans]